MILIQFQEVDYFKSRLQMDNHEWWHLKGGFTMSIKNWSPFFSWKKYSEENSSTKKEEKYSKLIRTDWEKHLNVKKGGSNDYCYQHSLC